MDRFHTLSVKRKFSLVIFHVAFLLILCTNHDMCLPMLEFFQLQIEQHASRKPLTKNFLIALLQRELSRSLLHMEET